MFPDEVTPLDEADPGVSYARPPSEHRDANLQPSRRPRDQNTGWPSRKRLATSPESSSPSLHRFAGSPESAFNPVMTSSLDSASEILDLSFFDDEVAPRERERESPVPPKPTAPALSIDLEDDDDLFYQYFPLSAEDWMESIEAVYCPHVNHYANPYSDMRRSQRQGKSRRYFTVKS
ncbi:hypothetical protein ACHAPT_011995 [Fusarium lateritium]